MIALPNCMIGLVARGSQDSQNTNLSNKFCKIKGLISSSLWNINFLLIPFLKVRILRWKRIDRLSFPNMFPISIKIMAVMSKALLSPKESVIMSEKNIRKLIKKKWVVQSLKLNSSIWSDYTVQPLDTIKDQQWLSGNRSQD